MTLDCDLQAINFSELDTELDALDLEQLYNFLYVEATDSQEDNMGGRITQHQQAVSYKRARESPQPPSLDVAVKRQITEQASDNGDVSISTQDCPALLMIIANTDVYEQGSIVDFYKQLHIARSMLVTSAETQMAKAPETMVSATILLIFMIMLPLGGEAAQLPPSGLLNTIFNYIDLHQDEFVQHLKEFLAVPSDSNDPQLRGELTRMMNLTADCITSMGATVRLIDLGSQKLSNGESIPMPPAILAELGRDPEKPTVCFYGHMDVQPALKEDGWNTDPYTMTEINGNLYARGATDNKGPVLAWLHAVETFKALKQDIPVNVKFIIEGMEEAGSPGLEELLKEQEAFFSNVDYIVISDNVWLSRKPALTYGTRGVADFFIEVQGAQKDLHSGTFGGITHEAMNDLIALLAKLVDSSGRILIPGVYDDVAPLTEEEKKLYTDIEFDLEEHKNNSGVTKFLQDTKEEVLLHLWRYPCLSIHGIEGAYYGTGSKTVIPAKVIGKFSIRQVPNMHFAVVEKQVVKYLKDEFEKLNSPNKMKVTTQSGALPWMGDVNDPQYEAARRAIIKVFGVKPDMIRDGSTIPIASTFQSVTKKSVMMLPIGGADDGEHSQNEKISRSNYIQGTKVFSAFLLELSEIHRGMEAQKIKP